MNENEHWNKIYATKADSELGWFESDLSYSLNQLSKVTLNGASTTVFVAGAGRSKVVDYLLKPISFDRFLKAVSKVMQTPLSETKTEEEVQSKKSDSNGYINFRGDRKMIKVALNDILYIESIKDYIKVVTVANTIITKQSISSVEEILPKEMFIRIHRSYIIALNKIESYNHELVWIAKQELPISRMYRHEVGKTLKLD